MTAPAQELIAEGRAALRRGDGADARRIFERSVGERTSGAICLAGRVL